jgi:NitT/TauT family transport system substrate-binding protein
MKNRMKRSSSRRAKGILGAALLAVSLAATGCGGGAGATSNGGGAENLTKVTVGYIPIASAAPILYGVENGFFKEEGLDVKMEPAQGGAALVPAIVSGQYQFAYSNNLSLMVAYGKRLPIKIVHTANGSGHEPAGANDALMVSAKSGIKSIDQLGGKTIAVNALNNVPQLGVMTALEKAGADPKSVRFVEIGYPDMGLALEQGRVDAAVMDEPFVTTASKSGSTTLGSPYRAISEDLPLSSWFTSQQVIEKDPEVVAKFYRAIEKSNKFAVANQETIRQFVPTFLKVDKELAASMSLADFPTGTPDLKKLDLISKESARFNLIPNVIANLENLVYEPRK